ncbi:hypothetical protein PAXRUDRAFT_505501 [Paxillus rubicundulus Ve08.2h10]|uniref:Uncharacterized protein n=1 Tax=Paxillus rubicundulus Ve08.2h10 TaxID=930991 RepID=A0A0D0DLL9_9AGAM|nr:hypothetical protein PAXRUDRAFT_505501 [Paxillus rubicundulus Ve08.2h10]
MAIQDWGMHPLQATQGLLWWVHLFPPAYLVSEYLCCASNMLGVHGLLSPLTAMYLLDLWYVVGCTLTLDLAQLQLRFFNLRDLVLAKSKLILCIAITPIRHLLILHTRRHCLSYWPRSYLLPRVYIIPLQSHLFGTYDDGRVL